MSRRRRGRGRREGVDEKNKRGRIREEDEECDE